MTFTWPAGWPRTAPVKRLRGDFGKSQTTRHGEGENSWTTTRKVGLQWTDAVRRVNDEIRRMGGTFPRIDTDANNDAEPGVVLSFRLGNRPVVFPCDRYKSKAQNLAAIAATLEAKRAIERHGVSTLEREFEGYLALGAGDGTTYGVQPAAVALPQKPHEVLGVAPDAPLEVCEAAWRALCKTAHPDRGGSDAQMHRLNDAIAQIRRSKPA
jgi:hypothetical protein